MKTYGNAICSACEEGITQGTGRGGHACTCEPPMPSFRNRHKVQRHTDRDGTVEWWVVDVWSDDLLTRFDADDYDSAVGYARGLNENSTD